MFIYFLQIYNFMKCFNSNLKKIDICINQLIT